MKEGFRQSMAWLHTWTGLVVGWILFFVFLTGTAGYVQIELTRWMQPEKALQSNVIVPENEQLDKAYDAQSKQSKAYADYLRLVSLRYKHGVSSALDLQDAERSSYSADAALLAGQLTRLENLADLYKALGGGLKQTTQQEVVQP